MGKLFSGNSDFIAVIVIVLTIGISSAFIPEFRAGRTAADRLMTRIPARTIHRMPARLNRNAVRLRLAALKQHHAMLKNIVCPR